MKQTLVLALPIDEASAKIRTGGAVDDEEDYALPVWAGLLPLRIVPQQPIADERLDGAVAVPDYIKNYKRRGW